MNDDYKDAGSGDVHDEIKAMSDAWEALRSLPTAGQQRAMRWLGSKLGTDQDASTR